MKTRLFTVILLCFIVVSASAKGAQDSAARQNEVVIYTYDSFISEWGPGPELVKLFEAETGLKCTMIDAGDGAQILSRAVLEKKAPLADVIIGIDNNQVQSARKADVLVPYKPANADSAVPSELRLTDDWLLTPYDWSYFAMICDTQSSVPAPVSLSDLTKPEYAKKIILMDPRTSTPGLGFVAWTAAVFGENYLDYWKALKSNILTMSPSWSTGYGLFTSGEAPLVISYTTSPAYHVEYGEGSRFQAVLFNEGHPIQIETASIVKGAPNRRGAELFIDFLISDKAQAVIPLTQWMYPVNPDVPLPASYSAAPKSSKTVTVDNDTLSKAVTAVTELLAQ